MAETSIAWTVNAAGVPGYTFNPWEGCQSVSPGCDNCYAEARNLRYAPKGSTTAPNWGPGAPRRRTSVQNWNKVKRWNAEAEAAGTRPLVFCASLADVFDNAVDPEWRRDLFDLIRTTPNLFWLILSKRPPKVIQRLYADAHLDPPDGGEPHPWPRNAALGRSYVNQEEIDRDLPDHLVLAQVMGVPFTFASLEPLLERVTLRNVSTLRFQGAEVLDALTGQTRGMFGEPAPFQVRPLGWVIVGGESGRNARAMDPQWAALIRAECVNTGVPFFFKQMGGEGPDKGGERLLGLLHQDPAPVPLEA